jgi:phosphate transport system protein
VPRVDRDRAWRIIAVAMLRKALDAFARLDVTASAEVVRQDQHVDAGFRGRHAPAHHLHDGRPPHHFRASIEILFIAKAIERIGDHAKNISEYVIYLVKGRDVRHIGLEAMEKEVAAR